MRANDASDAKLVTADWLAGEIDKPDIVVVDGSWYLPTQNRNAHGEFLAGHVPGAVFFDHDAIVDPASDLPHTLPSAEDFALAAGKLGLAADKRIVVYDGVGLFTAPRVWWMLRLFGAEDVAILAGGYPAWIAGDRPVETGESTRLGTVFAAAPDLDAVADAKGVSEALGSGSAQVVDVRASARYRGLVAEPRVGLRSGHMPGSLNRSLHGPARRGAFQERRRDAHRVAGRRRRPRPAGDHQLRVGRHGRGSGLRPRAARQDGREALRRIVVRMGWASGSAGRAG